ncbi:hypothetical protein [Streptomyces albus]|uniref:hypothetical protein n=1 Tax=Streptomyces sp. PHES57 TaxID=2872626 RepID=UPI001CEC3D4F|nr:hypothetical protein [Streptomyces sp. PHES57]
MEQHCEPARGGGLVLLGAGMFWLSRLHATSTYAGGVLGPLLISGTGVGLALVAHNLVVVTETDPSEAGAAAGVLQATLTLGGAIGLAALVTVFQAAGAGLAAGVAATFTAATVIMAAALLSAVLLLRNPQPRDRWSSHS